MGLGNQSPKPSHQREVIVGIAGINFHRCAHTRTQAGLQGVSIQLNSHRNALHHFDPVTRSVLCRQHRKPRTSRLRYALYDTVEFFIGIGIHFNKNRLAGFNAGQIGGVGCDTIKRCEDSGVCSIKPGRFQGSQRSLVIGVFF